MPAVALTAGTRLGLFEITAQIGAGGMGEVYRARDTKLDRPVAIKILPGAFAHDPDRLARFGREARALAALNHPNIAIVHGFEESNGVQALVMELVEGPTLADRIALGPIPLDEGLLIARQIVEALEASHEQGIVHRDLKPANIKLRPDGIVKVLDFGLAKVLEIAPGAANATMTPTITSPAATRMGVILGTAAYMSPEQARGLVADKRSDMWAFGCVLYEILTGRRAFEGDGVSDTLANVLKTQPDWKALPPGTPAAVRRLLRRSLTRDPKGRIADASTARLEIDDVLRGSPDIDGEIVRTPTRRREWLLWVSALAVTTLIAAIAVARTFRPVAPAPERRLDITAPPTTDPWSLSMSPDGEKVAFVATSEGRPVLWLRSMDSASARPLAGTDRAFLPFWSPDSRSVGFFAEGQLKRIDIAGGTIQTVVSLARPAEMGLGGTWNRNDVIVFSKGPGSALFRVPASGGTPVAVTRVETPQQQHHYWPTFLPDGRHFLYYVLGDREASGVYVGQLDGSPPLRLLEADGPAVFVSTGHLLLLRRDSLFAQRLDPVRLELIGDPFPVAEQVRAGYGPMLVSLSASATGSFVYRSGSSAGVQELAWLDRSGNELEKVSGSESGLFFPSLSPDGRRVAVSRVVDGNIDIWTLDSREGVVRLSRVTTDPADDVFPTWSRDGTRIAYTSTRMGESYLYQRLATGGGSEVLLSSSVQPRYPTDWSRDGRLLIYSTQDPMSRNDIWALPLDGDRKPFSIVKTESDQEEGQLSPDGQWIAYQSNESGRFEVYVQPFSGSGRKSLISTAGGYQPRWRRDGKELFYITGHNQLVAVPIQVASDGQVIEPGAPVPLFVIRTVGPIEADRWYDVSPDGQRFLVNRAIADAASPVTVVLNWTPQQ